MKKQTAVLLSVFILAALFTGCSGSTGEKAELNLFIWTEYIPDSVLEKFTDETGIKVNISTYSSNEDLLSKVKASNKGIYDIVVPSDYMVKMMIEEGLLDELDMDSIPNIVNIGRQYLDSSFDPGNKYSVPFMGGVAALGVNTSMVDETITSYSQIFDPKFENSIVMLDDPRAIIGMVAKSMGYSMNETDSAILTEVGDRLMELKPNVKALDSDSPKSLMISGETSIGLMWNAEVALSMAENPDIQIVYPEEGCYLFLDNLCVLEGAKNRENAETFINFILDPEVSKMISEEFPYINPNTKAIELLGDSYINNPAINVPEEVFANGEYIQDLDGETLNLYDTLWTEFTN